MIQFTDGPAAMVFLSLRRAPLYLRVVRSAAGEFDALDQLDDEPAADETVFVYRLAGKPAAAFVDGTRNGRRCGWREVMATYVVVTQQPDDATMRDTAKWREWCVEQQARDKAGASEAKQ